MLHYYATVKETNGKFIITGEVISAFTVELLARCLAQEHF